MEKIKARKIRINTAKFNLDRMVNWNGGVNHATSQEVLDRIKLLLQNDKDAPVYLTVTSPGGGTGIGMGFYDTIKTVYKPNLTTIGTGDVDSSGIIVFLSGDKRYITPNTTLLLHLAGRTFDGGKRFTAQEMESMLREDTLKDFQYASVVSERSGGKLSTEKVLDMMAKSTVLSAEEAMHYGLAHEILKN